jgi:hypothetical protein
MNSYSDKRPVPIFLLEHMIRVDETVPLFGLVGLFTALFLLLVNGKAVHGSHLSGLFIGYEMCTRLRIEAFQVFGVHS